MNRLLLALLALLTGLTAQASPVLAARQADAVVAMASATPVAVRTSHAAMLPAVRSPFRGPATAHMPDAIDWAPVTVRTGIDRARE
jgi:hypothetical protein